MRENAAVEMWNNPGCSKCATARETLDAARVPYRVRAYLDDPPNAIEFTEVLRRLGAQPWEVCRLGEPEAQTLGMADWPREAADAQRWIDAMVAHPNLIQRPILLFDDGSALVARTPEALDAAVGRAAG